MATRHALHAQARTFDPRIPPFEEYIEEDSRPYQNGDLISFKLKKFINSTDLSNEGPGRNGGDNGHGTPPPMIIYGAAPIDTTSPKDPKVQGSATGSIGKQSVLDDSESDSFPTDSEEDLIGYEHRLARIAQAIHNHEPVLFVIVGEFKGYQDQHSQCEFRLEYTEGIKNTMQEYFETNWRRICDISMAFGGNSVPGSLVWTRNQVTDDILHAPVYRFGKGVKARFQDKTSAAKPMSTFEATFVVDLNWGLSIAFPAAPRLTDATLMQYMVNITASWDGSAFGPG
jgi:hypothetical protein